MTVNSKSKIIVFGILAALGGVVGYFYSKQEVARKVLDEIKVKFKSIDKIKYDAEKMLLSFRLKIALKNTTGYDFGLLVGGFTIKKVRIYDQHYRLLADANVNAKDVVFPANGEYTLPPSRLEMGVKNAGTFLMNATGDITELYKQLIYEVDVKAFGINHTITIE